MSAKIRVAVVDDHPLFLEGVIRTLQAEPDLEVVGQGASADDAARLACSLTPDLILLDLTMPGGGLEAARQITADCPAVKALMLTASADEDDLLASIKAGARGYILKGVSSRELANILRTVHAGQIYVAPSLAGSLLVGMAGSGPRSHPVADPLDRLTERERQILDLVAQGQSNKAIGRSLFLTEKTVKHYVTSILRKLDVHNRVEAALLGHQAAQASHQVRSGQ